MLIYRSTVGNRLPPPPRVILSAAKDPFPMKARKPSEALKLSDLPNIGPAMVRDFALLGIRTPAGLKGRDPYKLYLALSRKTKSRQDPCVLDTFIAAVRFMNGDPPRPWYWYTPERKKKYPEI
jgi:hypothetical protein